MMMSSIPHPRNLFCRKLEVFPGEHSHGLCRYTTKHISKKRRNSDDLGLRSTVVPFFFFSRKVLPTYRSSRSHSFFCLFSDAHNMMRSSMPHPRTLVCAKLEVFPDGHSHVLCRCTIKHILQNERSYDDFGFKEHCRSVFFFSRKMLPICRSSRSHLFLCLFSEAHNMMRSSMPHPRKLIL